MKKLQATEYMYASARLRAMENRLIGRERMELLIEARSSDEVMDRLAEYGISPAESEAEGPAGGAEEGAAREGMLLALLKNAYAEVEAAVPDPAAFRYFRYPYECNNLKAAIKCAVRGIPAGDMLFDFGTVPAEEVETLLREGKYAAFPKAMAAAVPVAKDAFDKTGDPRRIDMVLDRACFADMLREATEAGDEVLLGWLRAKIDLLNLLMCLRISRMGMGAVGRGFLEESLLPGGTLTEAFLLDAYDGGETYLFERISHTPYNRLAAVECAPDLRPLSAVEKAADDTYVELVRKDARTPFGAAVAGGYLVGCETAVKNIRILLAAKDAGLSSDTIRERIRVSYV